jgi:hypothetical protein
MGPCEANVERASDGPRVAFERRKRGSVPGSIFQPRDGARRRAHPFCNVALQQAGAQPGERELAA